MYCVWGYSVKVHCIILYACIVFGATVLKCIALYCMHVLCLGHTMTHEATCASSFCHDRHRLVVVLDLEVSEVIGDGLERLD